ncbi:uncharacterized protein LOC105892329 [Clupea harengus]|uniref:Uncharacterized protein LOC105892329 n=1 Tax=Clupea harengus TaxID=7950 RepID=A0A6P3VK90_CLUHA|nr:uncharacterized protein LOC105892329 [Clupea harengus]
MSLTGQKDCVCKVPSGRYVSASQSSPTPAWATLPPCSSLKPARSGFRKVSSAGEAGPCPIPGLAEGVLEMRVREGSKIRNLLGFAMARMQGGVQHGGRTALSQVLFTGSGRAITKTITCAEIMKRQIRGLHQVSKLQHCTVREEWEGGDSIGSRMTIHRMVPAICILLSKEALDPREPGYQPPEEQHSSSDPREPGYQPPEEQHSSSDPREPGYQPPVELHSPSDNSMPVYQPPDKLYTSSQPSQPAELLHSLSDPSQPAELLHSLSDPSQPGCQPPDEPHSATNRSKLGYQTSAEACPLTHPRQPEEELYSLSEEKRSAHHCGVSRKRPLSPCSPSRQAKAKSALFEEGNI